MIWQEANDIALKVVEELKPHCIRIEIAGSVRRQKPEVKDIEIVLIAKPFNIGMFESGIASVINEWPKLVGQLDLDSRYTQRLHPSGIKLDIFIAREENWGLIYAIRTGSADYSHLVLASTWSKRGFKSVNGQLRHKDDLHTPIILREEKDLFDLLAIPMPFPHQREVQSQNNTVGRGVMTNFEKTQYQFNGGIDQ